METVKRNIREDDNHKHQELNSKQWKKENLARSQAELEASLKAQEYREMLKRLK